MSALPLDGLSHDASRARPLSEKNRFFFSDIHHLGLDHAKVRTVSTGSYTTGTGHRVPRTSTTTCRCRGGAVEPPAACSRRFGHTGSTAYTVSEGSITRRKALAPLVWAGRPRRHVSSGPEGERHRPAPRKIHPSPHPRAICHHARVHERALARRDARARSHSHTHTRSRERTHLSWR